MEQLTAITILSDEIFEGIIDIVDEVEREKKIIQYTTKAKALGVKGDFDRILKAHLKTEKKFLASLKVDYPVSVGMNITNFNHPIHPELVSGNWQADTTGVRAFGMYGEMLACYHPIMPVRRLVNLETGKEKLTIAFNKDGDWIEKIFDKSIVASANKIMAIADFGISVTSESARYMVKYLNDIENMNVNQIPKQISTARMGWTEDFKIFMPYSNEIVFDSESSLSQVYNSIHEKGSRADYIEKLKDIRKHNGNEPKMAIAASLASVLLKPLGILPFILHIYGLSGKGKTVVSMWAASIWGNPNQKEFMSDPKNTVTVFEVRLNFLNNLPFICDDMAQLKQYLSGQRHGDFSEFIYLLCSGKGKERSNINLGINHISNWQNVSITNGEKSLLSDVSNGGEINRVIEVKTRNGYIFEDGRQMSNFLRLNYGFLGHEFIEVVQKIGVQAVERIFNTFIDVLEKKSTKLEVAKEQKQLLPIAAILTADKILTDHILQDGIYLDIDYVFKLMKSASEMSDNERAYEFIKNEVEIHKKKFSDSSYSGECWGLFKDDYVLINQNAFNKFSEQGNFDKKMFIEWGVENDVCQVSRDRLTKQLKTTGKRYYWVKVKEDFDYSDSIIAEND